MEIWKFKLLPIDQQEIEMPEGAEILCVQEQNHFPIIWALVNPEVKKIKRKIMIRGTGMSLLVAREKATYIGTVQLEGGRLVFHVFDCVSY